MTGRSFARAVNRKIRAERKIEEPTVVFDLTMYEEGEEGEPVLDAKGKEIKVDGETLLAKPLENGHGGPLLDEDGNQIVGVLLRQSVFHAKKPGDDFLLVTMIEGGRSTASIADRAAVVFDFFEHVLPPVEFRILMARLKDDDDELDLKQLREIYDWLEEEFSTFPTKSPSDSSPRQQQNGKNSTGRSPSKRASTPSSSPSSDS